MLETGNKAVSPRNLLGRLAQLSSGDAAGIVAWRPY